MATTNIGNIGNNVFLTNTNPIYSSPNTNVTLPIATVQQLLGQAAKPAYAPKMTPFGTALMEAVGHATDSTVMTTEQHAFRVLSGNDAINCFGKLRPHMSLRPKKWAEMLLRTCPSPTQAYSKTASFYYHQAVGAGLMYALPLIYGSKRTRFRLTASGIVLLDYYADRWPDFAPFVSAYLPKKAREEIQCDSCDFIMGIEPEWLKKEKAKAEEAKAAFTMAQQLKDAASLRSMISQQANWANQNQTAAVTPYFPWQGATSQTAATTIGAQQATTGWSFVNQALSQNAVANLDQTTWTAVQAAAKRLVGKK
jgi:hypothetical protein